MLNPNYNNITFTIPNKLTHSRFSAFWKQLGANGRKLSKTQCPICGVPIKANSRRPHKTPACKHHVFEYKRRIQNVSR